MVGQSSKKLNYMNVIVKEKVKTSKNYYTSNASLMETYKSINLKYTEHYI